MPSATQLSGQQLHFSEVELLAFAEQTCLRLGLTLQHARAIARVVVAGQRDDCQSHGLYRLLTVAQTIRAGKVKLNAQIGRGSGRERVCQYVEIPGVAGS